MSDMSYPKGEKVCIIYVNTSGEEQLVMTEKDMHTSFTLWEREENAWKKLGRAKTPTELEDEHDVLSRLRKRDSLIPTGKPMGFA